MTSYQIIYSCSTFHHRTFMYHLGRGHIGTSMKAKLYHLLEHRAATCRYFVIPLWRGSGYTTMFAQGGHTMILFGQSTMQKWPE